ncbi:MAG: universal stress protein, partial [Actinobacteria bacterium]|nr:universal stress protein [Actinomycetota bacterium]
RDSSLDTSIDRPWNEGSFRGSGTGDFMKRIIATTDGSERAGRAVTFASQMAQCFGADLTLIHVRKPGAAYPEPAIRAQAEQAKASVEIVEAEKPAEAICETAEDLDADAIVIGNYGMSDRKEFLLGNVPNRVSHQAQCTVIIVDTRDAKDKKRQRRGR